MELTIRKATRKQKKIRIALIGASGSGKTLTALELATGLARGGKIGIIDTERGRSELYADRYPFDLIALTNFDPNFYIAALSAFEKGGYAVCIIDSLSHSWTGEGGVLDKVNRASGNKFTDGWGKVGTPLQNKLIAALLDSPMHLIITLRTKVDYEMEEYTDERGNKKSKPVKIGLAPVARADMEYEFDMIWRMDMSHTATIEKSFDDNLPVGMSIPTPNRSVAANLIQWLERGEIPPLVTEKSNEPRYEPHPLAEPETIIENAPPPAPISVGNIGEGVSVPSKRVTSTQFWEFANAHRFSKVDAGKIINACAVAGKTDWEQAVRELEAKVSLTEAA